MSTAHARISLLRKLPALLAALLLTSYAAAGRAAPDAGVADLGVPPRPAAAPDLGAAPPAGRDAPAAPPTSGSAASGSTGAGTPATQRELDLFYLAHRCIPVDEDLVINIRQKSEKGLKVTAVHLFYPQTGDEHVRESTPAGSPPPDAQDARNAKVERSVKIDLTSYISLDAANGTLHVDLRRAHLDEHLRPETHHALWDASYALFGNEHAVLQITYELRDGDKVVGAARIVSLYPDISNRIRGLFWGIIGLLFSIGITVIVGRTVLPRAFLNEGRIRFPNERSRRWHLLLGITMSPDNRYSVSALQVVIWTHLAAFTISYVWTMTGEVVRITPQMLGLLGTSGLTAVLSGFMTPSGTVIPREYLLLAKEDRLPQLRDLLTSNDAPSIYKFQMLIFTVLAAAVVAWEVIRAYVFPVLPDELVLLMGISNGTYVLGSAGSKSSHKELLDEIQDKCKEIDQAISDHNANAANTDKWTRKTVIDLYRTIGGAAQLGGDLQEKLARLKELLARYFA